MKNIIKKIICVSLAAALTAGPVSAYALADTIGTREHSISGYVEKYDKYEEKYLSGCGTALDGTDGTADTCIPGLEEGMVPQGMTYWQEKDCFLVSAYSNDKALPSTVYAIDRATGEETAEYLLYNTDDEMNSNHVGGVAASDVNLYIATGSRISYVPLETLSENYGKSAKIILAGEKNMSTEKLLNRGAVSYLSYSEGVLWTGNYYSALNTSYNTKATDSGSSIIIGMKLTEENQWDNFLAITEPTYKINVPELLQDIQCATYSGGKLIIGTSHGSLLDSALIICDLDLEEGRTLSLTDCSMKLYPNLPMSEGIFVLDGTLYNLYESGAVKFVSNPFSRNGTDVIWQYDFNKIAESDMSFISRIRVFFIRTFR